MCQNGEKYSKIRQFVTVALRYTVGMNTFFALNNLLISSAVLGAVWLVVLFVTSFFAVHVIKLARLGLNAQPKPKEEKPAPKPPERKNEPASTPEPVYYIVERKRKRAKSSYSTPKEIKFK